MSRRSRILLDDQFAMRLLGDLLDFAVERVLAQVDDLIDSSVKQVGIDTLGDLLLGHLQRDVQDVSTLSQSCRGHVTHAETLATTGSGQDDVECLARNSSAGNDVEHVQVESDLVLLLVIKLEATIRILQIIVSDIGVEGDAQRLGEDVRNHAFAVFPALAVNDADGLHDGQIDRTILAPLFGGVYQPFQFDRFRHVDVANRLGDVHSIRGGDIVRALKFDVQHRAVGQLVVFADELEYQFIDGFVVALKIFGLDVWQCLTAKDLVLN